MWTIYVFQYKNLSLLAKYVLFVKEKMKKNNRTLTFKVSSASSDQIQANCAEYKTKILF